MDFRDFRKQVAGQTQAEVADATGLTQATISRIEAQRQVPSSIVLIRIQAWADAIARRKRLPPAGRLTWDWLERRGAA